MENEEKCLLVDVSLYQPNMDWKILANNGVAGVIIRASAGSYRQDPMFLQHVKSADSAGMIIGAYHWLDPNNDDVAQAQNFLNAVKNQPIRFLALDMEQYWKYWSEYFAHDVKSIIPGSRISENALRVATYLRKNSKLPVVVYTRASFVSYRTPQAKEWLPDYNLWLAYYPYSSVRITTTWEDLKSNYLPILNGPILPEKCTEWSFWQFSGNKFRLEGTGNVVIDLNFFNGNKHDLENFCSTGTVPIPDSDPELPRKARTRYRINIRTEPRVAYDTYVSTLAYGTIVNVYEIKQIGWDKWARIDINRWAAMEYRNVRLMVWV
jgi:GH25 family lysozyme M1 (1,4-beta-N-acetylmuramidase)